MCNYFNIQDANGYISYSAQTVQKKWGALSVEAQVEHVRLADLQMKSFLGEPPYTGEALSKWIAASILKQFLAIYTLELVGRLKP